MNKVAIKNFAVEARKKLIASVKDKAGRIGIAKENITEAISKGEGYAVFPTHIGIETTLMGKELKQRDNLVNRIKEKGYDSVIEEVAYTWFNRIIAVRFMEVNDYLPSRIRVLSSETNGKFEPDIVTQAPKIDLNLTRQETEEIISLKEKNELDKLFRMLFIKQCNELSEILPELFENTSKYDKDYTEILLDISYTNEDGVIRDLLKIDEEDFLDAVEIIGWMYQYYISEPKDVLINAKNIYKKEEVPFVTQLFTSDWIVRYMVENSLGRIWIEGHPNDTLKSGWKYYLDEAEQKSDEIAQYEKIRAEYKDINPEEIKVIDPCMGSGHILVYAFDILMQIYESCGYSARDAASLIVEKNLYGLDIDDRAYQLSYFAVMMKGRKYDRRFLTKIVKPNLCSIQESNALSGFEQVSEQLKLEGRYNETVSYLIGVFKDAKEYGSILNIEQRDYDGLLNHIEKLGQIGSEDLFVAAWLDNISAIMPELIKQAKIMAQQYEVVCTNPPYLNAKYMPLNLKDYIESNYANYKSDMFSAFMVKCSELCKKYGHIGMITPYVWMFISSYEKLRENLLTNRNLSSLIQLEYNAFEAACVPVCTFTIRNNKCTISGEYVKLSDFKGIDVQAPKTLEAVKDRNCGYRFTTFQENFSKIPGMPIAYWLRNYNVFDNISLSKTYFSGGRNKTHDNIKYVRKWWEIKDHERWQPYVNGGGYKKWYGNHEDVVDWKINARNEYASHGGLYNEKFWNKEGIYWNLITSNNNGFRIKEKRFHYSSGSPTIFNDSYKCNRTILGFLNTCVSMYLIKMINPTLNTTVSDVLSLPCIITDEEFIDNIVSENINLSKIDWDNYEISWDFEKHPLIQNKGKISDCFTVWKQATAQQFNQLKTNEEELNRVFIGIYGFQDELIPEVEDKDVTINTANLTRDVRSLISYAVGSMFGRYSLDVEGLAYAGGEWDDTKYVTFTPDKENIILIADEEYFNNDIVARFVRFAKEVYGEDFSEENLDFIANALGNKGATSREVIRNYFLKDFYKDHVKIYQKHPIYWLFDSGKENGFKALIYLHRYDEDTVGRVRADYLHKTQAAIENAIANCDVIFESNASASDKAKAVKQKGKLVKQLAETRIYDQAIAHIAHQRISLDLDDGVAVNYAKFQGIEVASEGKKSVKVNLLGKI